MSARHFLYFNDFKYLIIRIYQAEFLVVWPGLKKYHPRKKNSAFDECFQINYVKPPKFEI